MNFISFHRLERTILANDPAADRELLRKAFDYAREVHAGQVRDEGTPYFVHPYRVALYMAQVMGVGDARVIASALLHDVIEDGDGVTPEVLKEMFGPEISESVHLLSKPPMKGFADKTARDEAYYRQLQSASHDVLMIKIADRLDNLRTLRLSPSVEKQRRYSLATRRHILPVAMERFPRAGEEMERLLSNREKGLETPGQAS